MVARQMEATGAQVLARRWRTSAGEIDLIVRDGEVLVFVEVKQRKRLSAWDSPISQAQWRRLEATASQYILHFQVETGIQPVCRFDVALVGHDGSVEIIENAWSTLT